MKMLLLGKNGQVGWELQRALAPLGELTAADSRMADFEDPDGLRRLVRAVRPQVIVNAAAYTAVDKAESEPERARVINADSVAVLAAEASAIGAWLVHYSTDYVFSGAKSAPYVEDDVPEPLSAYGRTKLEGEQAIRKNHDRHLIFRTSWVYAARGSNFAKTMLRLAQERDELNVVGDQYGAPTSAELVADVTALALYRVARDAQGKQTIAGTYHLVASGETTWCDYAKYVIGRAIQNGVNIKAIPQRIRAIPTEAYPLPATRPKNSRLDTRKLQTTFDVQPPEWRHQVARMVDELTT
jgi:dTDP-4-dehydrorhamnose reductase